ncbi:MAG: anhydro-N-acetylmuramic acid kinase, partial [Arenimonas sp.]
MSISPTAALRPPSSKAMPQCRRHWGIAFDDGGRRAAAGEIDAELLERLLLDPWLQLPPPKSTGRDYFQ